MDALQMWCTAQAMSVARFLGEELAQFFRKRVRIAGFAARRACMWSDRASELVIAFREQLLAESPPTSWPARLMGWLGSEWVRDRRIACGSESVFAGRIGFRLLGGGVAPRWDESVRLLQRMRGR